MLFLRRAAAPVSPAYPALGDRITYAIAEACANALARLVSLRYPIHHLPVGDDACELAGLRLGSTERCVFVHRCHGPGRWRLDLWDEGDCVKLDVLGWRCEVFYDREQARSAGLNPNRSVSG